VGLGVAVDVGDSDGVALGDAEEGVGVGDADGAEPGAQAASDPSRSSARRCARRSDRVVFTRIISLDGC